MHKNVLTWLLIGFMAAFCSAAFAQDPAAPARPPGVIKVAKVTGTVTARTEAGTVTLAAGAELGQGAVITTGKDASVVLVFSNGATINLAQDSVLSIDEFLQDPFPDEVAVSKLTAEPTVSNTKLNLSRGELVGNVKKLNHDGGSTFNIQTPVGAAGIRGTTFRIVFRPDGTGKAFFSLTTVEGNVVLASGVVNMPANASVANNQEVSVELDVEVDATTGNVTVTAPGTEPITVTPASAASAQQVAEVINQVAQTVATVTFTPSSGSSSNSGGGSSNNNSGNSNNGGSNDNNGSGNNGSPPASQSSIRTTSGDGKTG